MKKLKKTYAIYNLSEKHTAFYLGKTRVNVSFMGGQVTKNGVNPATFTTDNPIVQLAIERSRAFADGAVKLLAQYQQQGEVKIGRNPPRLKVAGIEKPTENAVGTIPEPTPADNLESNPESNPEPAPTYYQVSVSEPATGIAEPASHDSDAPTQGVTYSGQSDEDAELIEEPESGQNEEPDSKVEANGKELEIVEVSCKDVAKQYLQEHYGERPAPLRTRTDIQECAAKYGITFSFV